MTYGVAAYSFPFSCGFLRRNGQCATPEPMDAFGLAHLATSRGLTGIESPLEHMLPDLHPDTITRLRRTLRESNLSLVVDTGVVDVDRLSTLLPLAALAGASVVRATLSTVLEGARAGLRVEWGGYMAEMRARIAAVLPLLEEHDLVLAIENHQDATSDDLVELCLVSGPRVGVTLDVANALAVGEEPLAFARKVGPLVRNVHLKDYQVHLSHSGYRLVRCALGQGVVPFDELLPLLGQVAPEAPLNIELAALHARHIRLLEDGWWESYPARDVRSLVPALRLVAGHAQPPDTEWRTPWEREAPDEELKRYERDEFEASVAYLRA